MSTEKFTAEMRAIELRLREVSEAAYGDMEGADLTEFRQSEVPYVFMREAANRIGQALDIHAKLEAAKAAQRDRGEGAPGQG